LQKIKKRINEFNSLSKMTVGVIISTYNNPKWLEKTLWSYLFQTYKADEIIVADDGSGDDTRQLVESFKDRLPIRHVWHPDNGFQKTAILNKALASATADYLIFTDQDLVARFDFVETHVRNAEKGYILSGGCHLLPMSISEACSYDDIATGRFFSLSWLRAHGLKLNFKCTKLLQNPRFASFMNHITTTKATWNGGNASGWREDLLAVNGFDERMQYGGEDRECGERLFNMGIKSKQIRYSAVILHLDHSRPYKNEAAWAKNVAIRKETKEKHVIRTPYGIEKLV